MKIIPLGVGGAFTKRHYHNNYIIQLDETFLLIDAGTTLRYSLPEAGFDYLAIDAVFISHLHFDHVGGLEEMLMQRFWHFENGQHSPQKTKVIVHEKLYSSLKNYLNSGLMNQGRTVDDYCDFFVLGEGEIFNIGHYQFHIFDTTNCHAEGLISAGFKLGSQQSNIVFTGDIKHLADAGILSQVDDKTVAIFQDVSFTFNGVHATFNEVLDYYPANLQDRIYAMHYNDNIEDYLNILDHSMIKRVKKQEILEF
ncbi:ribonuclease Z [Lysinibacillus yapensis]|uniref:Ribonuclease Z n=1 Tax=Ureibacillus yapensis TaxID=2304605 RepID=A0A396SAE6_9BACL|nr:MBL fold metallo-hydrolase [Lysinibacillus yapensis]RHW31457.1 ribonuclease Z [Lysinibacillus yapensis]